MPISPDTILTRSEPLDGLGEDRQAHVAARTGALHGFDSASISRRDCERIGFSGGTRSIVALVTPMRVDGILVWEALDALIEYESLKE